MVARWQAHKQTTSADKQRDQDADNIATGTEGKQKQPKDPKAIPAGFTEAKSKAAKKKEAKEKKALAAQQQPQGDQQQQAGQQSGASSSACTSPPLPSDGMTGLTKALSDDVRIQG